MVDYDASTALVVVDLQNDFADPTGSLFVQGGDAIVARINDELERAAADGALLVYTQDWHPPSTPHFKKDGGIWPVHCVAGTWGAHLHPLLNVAGPRIRKGSNGEDGYSGFTMRDPVTGEERPTELESLLRELDVTRLVISGLATDYCVRGTVLDACRLGFDTSVLTDAIAAVELASGDAAAALAEMSAAGARLI